VEHEEGIEMERSAFDTLVMELRSAVEVPGGGAFPLDAAVRVAQAQERTRRDLISGASGARGVTEDDLHVLAMFDITSASAAIAIRKLAADDAESAGITTALVDLWGRSEAGRCLWFDAHSLFSGDEAAERSRAAKESARLLAPEAIAIAFRLSTPVVQYVEFVSKVIP